MGPENIKKNEICKGVKKIKITGGTPVANTYKAMKLGMN
jgi:hypothetical protein